MWAAEPLSYLKLILLLSSCLFCCLGRTALDEILVRLYQTSSARIRQSFHTTLLGRTRSSQTASPPVLYRFSAFPCLSATTVTQQSIWPLEFFWPIFYFMGFFFPQKLEFIHNPCPCFLLHMDGSAQICKVQKRLQTLPTADNLSLCVCSLWESVVRFLILILSCFHVINEDVIHTEAREKGAAEYTARTMGCSPRSLDCRRWPVTLVCHISLRGA